MKILFIHKSTLGAFGDAAMHYYPAMLARAGHEVSIIARQGGNADALRSEGVNVIEIPTDAAWIPEVVSNASKLQPDIVHVFLYTGCGLLPFSLRNKCNSRFILDIRSPLLRTGLARLLHRAKNIIEPVGYHAVAAHGIESARTQIGSLWDVEFLPPGVDFSIVPQLPKIGTERQSGESLKLVYIGSLDWLRRLDLMLEGMAVAMQQCTLTLDIYGDGSERGALEHFAASKGLGESVHFRGRLDRQDLFEKLVNYDAGLSYVPGGMYDTAPALKTLEYLACGLPVLASNTFGNRMFVKEGINGFLIENTPAGFADGLLRMCKVRLDILKGHTQESVMDFDWSRIVSKRLLPLYTKLLSAS